MGTDEGKHRAPGLELRRQAEQRLYSQRVAIDPPESFHEAQRLFYELQVYQIELELQNAEILRSRDDQEALLEKYTDLYDFAPVGYFTLDRDGVIGSANLSGASLLGTERGRLLGRRLGTFVSDAARPLFSDFLDTAFKRQEKVFCDLPLPVPKDPRRFVRMEAVVTESGTVCRLALVDITEQKLSEEKIIRLNNELEQRVIERTLELESSNQALHRSCEALEASYRELEVFSYAVAHDLRSPLRSMNCFSNILLEDHSTGLEEAGKELLKRIGEAAGRMGQLVDGILGLAGLTRRRLSRCMVDLSALARQIMGELHEREPERTVDFVHAEGVIVLGDPHLLRQVLENLLGNAWKYTGKCASSRIEFGVLRPGKEAVYFVRDNGIGFDMQHTAKLFVPFERLHGMHEYEGVGIGLAIVQRIVSRHGGRVWAEAEANKGASFYFTLDQNPGLPPASTSGTAFPSLI